MKTKAPLYFKDFKCIADKCRHSCCVGWEIDVDSDAVFRYKSLGESGAAILSSLEYSEDIPHFKLVGERCPHLEAGGLCRIISEHGEEYLCDICREHPRFYNYNGAGCEAGLGAACEEAARLILRCENYSEAVTLSEDAEECEMPEFDAVIEREKIYKTLSDLTRAYTERLSALWSEYVSPMEKSDAEWQGVISELEYLDGKNCELFCAFSLSSAPPSEELAERALAYFIYRHTGSAETKEEFRLSLGLAFFLERLFASLMAKSPDADPSLLLRTISEEIEYSEDNTEAIKSEFV